ncbi:arginine deiminase [Companilactobacillus allii]|uniref:Arginine deiminase n=1 Tax=Companilactobacillus allii TaxID=1847728 RepID=A0A1P8Q3T3_9LACO|nr:arginine deiminase [Companilactobacillus allii]APX72507.1 arginine deiminase [Companilactobacillus allii]USQ69610.1 arginine deiminase [Companilactobacillus allii]
MTKPIHVTSEIGKLDVVLLKRPSEEVENITPDTMSRLLFDDIPYLPIAQKEHDNFAQILRDSGTEVLYLDDLVAEAIESGDVKSSFLDKMLSESGYAKGCDHDALREYLINLDTQSMVKKLMVGVRKNEIDFTPTDLVSAAEDADYPFFLDPMPNLYFTRDPAAAIGEGISINHMTYSARQRESMFMELIIAKHPRFADKGVHVWRDRNHTKRIEGGDELVLNNHVLAIGVSQRTSATAIQDIARNLFKDTSGFDTVLAISIPHNHAMMHLDTVFTMINYDQFTVHPGILGKGGKIDTWMIHPGNGDELVIEHGHDLKDALKKVLDLDDLDLIATGGGDPIVAPREQWNDGSNTLAIAPGVVVTYDRNYVSNEILRQHGIKVIETISSELSRGRGGPRCMSMPLVREDI